MFRNHKSAFKDKPIPLGHVGDLLISGCKNIKNPNGYSRGNV